MAMVLFAILVPLLYGAAYAMRAAELAARGRPVPGWRKASFGAGLACLALAASPWVGGRDDRVLTAHMIEHLLIGDLAPLLLVLGCSGPILVPLLRTRLFKRMRWVGNPALALGLWSVTLYGWHVPAAYDAALRSPALHTLQHTCFFLAGVNLWFALLGPLPRPAWFGIAARLGYVTFVWLAGSALAAMLAFSHQAFYAYGVDDQSAAGAIMMGESSAVAVAVFCGLFLSMWDAEPRRQPMEPR